MLIPFIFVNSIFNQLYAWCLNNKANRLSTFFEPPSWTGPGGWTFCMTSRCFLNSLAAILSKHNFWNGSHGNKVLLGVIFQKFANNQFFWQKFFGFSENYFSSTGNWPNILSPSISGAENGQNKGYLISEPAGLNKIESLSPMGVRYLPTWNTRNPAKFKFKCNTHVLKLKKKNHEMLLGIQKIVL